MCLGSRERESRIVNVRGELAIPLKIIIFNCSRESLAGNKNSV